MNDAPRQRPSGDRTKQVAGARAFEPLLTTGGRLRFLDIARGLAIVLMVFQHVQLLFAVGSGIETFGGTWWGMLFETKRRRYQADHQSGPPTLLTPRMARCARSSTLSPAWDASGRAGREAQHLFRAGRPALLAAEHP